MKISSWVFIFGSAMCFFAVFFGAFGAHAFHDLLVEYDRLATFETASQYHFFHAFVLLLLSLIDVPKTLHSTKVSVVYCFVCGIIVFSGSLYILSLTNIGIFGAITPIGGLLLLIAWLGMVKIGWQWR